MSLKYTEEELYKSMDNLKGRIQKLEQNQDSFQDLFLNLLHRLNQFQDKMIVIGILNHWFLKSSEEYKLFDSETIHQLSKKYHLNVSKEPISLPKKLSAYLQVIKFCHEHQYMELYRNEVQSLLNIKKRTALRIMKEIVQENPILFDFCQKEKNSMSYLGIKDKQKLKQEYSSFFNP